LDFDNINVEAPDLSKMPVLDAKTTFLIIPEVAVVAQSITARTCRQKQPDVIARAHVPAYVLHICGPFDRTATSPQLRKDECIESSKCSHFLQAGVPPRTERRSSTCTVCNQAGITAGQQQRYPNRFNVPPGPSRPLLLASLK